jgi:N-acetyl-anhydromuramyl-L-alanine amidase AmpD
MANRKATSLLVVHVTATPAGRDIGVKEVRAMHKAKGWTTIGYNELIRLDGQLEEGRGVDAVGAHVAGFNSIAYGIALVGGIGANGKPENTATHAQMVTLERRLREVADIYPDAGVCGHRDLSPDRDGDGIIEPSEHIKACPCFDAIPWAASVGLPTANIKGVWGETQVIPSSGGNAFTAKVAGPDARNVYLQKLLAMTGITFGPVDGIIGAKTKKALRIYQELYGLPVTGQFDVPTVARLRATFETAKAA